MKCNYNGCSSKCKGNIDVESCNVLRAYQQGKKDGRTESVYEFISYVEKEMPIWIGDAGDAISEIYELAKAFIKE